MERSRGAMFRSTLVLVLAALVQGQAEERLINIEQGHVKGYLSDNGQYFEFHGIPYATAPTGDDKFKAPLDPPTWTNVFEAVDNQIVCPQVELPGVMKFGGHQQEDCLITNVFVPKTTEKSLPVMVYVHGGAFYIGSGNMVTHELLLRHNVIVVNFNYRLGAQGFVCLGTNDIPGNAGMKDQVAALRWVKKNIAKFGGNPNDITIAGFSAGSASVELLMLSPMAKGLFNKVICESGSALSPWATNPDPLSMAKRFITDISGENFEDLKDIEKYFKSLTMKQLTSKMYFTEKNSNLGFSICVEPITEGQESFFNESPLDIIKSGKYNLVPFITGFASEEGLFRIELFDYWKDKMEADFSVFLPQDLVFESEAEKKSVGDKVKKFYFGNEPVSIKTIRAYVDYFTDVMFGYSTVRSARLHAQNSVPVYLYEYSYQSANSLPHAHSDKITGAAHGAQVGSINKIIFFKNTNYTESDILMQDRLTKMWTDFAKYGEPVRTTSDLLPAPWKPMDASTVNYLSMDLEMSAKERLLGDRVKFWDTIYNQYYREPTAPFASRVHSEL